MATKEKGALETGRILTLSHDSARLLDFGRRDPIRYRHLIHWLEPPCPAWDDAMSAYYPGTTPDTPMAYYVDRPERIGLIATYWGGKLKLEGDVAHGSSSDGLREWCTQLDPQGVATTSEELSDLLSDVVGHKGWSVNFHYTATPKGFRGRTLHEVFQLSPSDRVSYEAFLDRPADTPFLSVQRANDNLARDLAFLSAGLPVECYAGCRPRARIFRVAVLSKLRAIFRPRYLWVTYSRETSSHRSVFGQIVTTPAMSVPSNTA